MTQVAREGDDGLSVDSESLKRLASLLGQRSEIDAEIAAITGRPALPGHIGEWIAAEIFAIRLEDSAVAKAIDGRFTQGPLAGRTVNVKLYGKREGLLDINEDPRLDYYLVLTGPIAVALSSRGATRPLVIQAAYLFDAHQLLDEQRLRSVKLGVASSVTKAQWEAAEIFPEQANALLPISDEQRTALSWFAGRG